jgi:hypothetical protein
LLKLNVQDVPSLLATDRNFEKSGLFEDNNAHVEDMDMPVLWRSNGEGSA